MMLFPNERDMCLPTLKPRATPKLRVEAMIAIDIAPRDGLIVILFGLWLCWDQPSTQEKMENELFRFLSGEDRKERTEEVEVPWARGL